MERIKFLAGAITQILNFVVSFADWYLANRPKPSEGVNKESNDGL
jgi:cytochrome c oxidase assembly factor CtaG